MPTRKYGPPLAPEIDLADLESRWGEMAPSARRQAMQSRIRAAGNVYLRIAARLGFRRTPSPPSPRRVAARAAVLTAIHRRARIEDLSNSQYERDPKERNRLVDDDYRSLRADRFTAELEPTERRLLTAPFRRISEEMVYAAAARIEGLAVLAWALQLCEPPSPVQPVDSDWCLDAVSAVDGSLSTEVVSTGPADRQQLR